MELARRRESVVVPALALAMALGAALMLAIGQAVGFRSDTAEDVFIVTALLGWALVVGAALVSGAYGVLLASRTATRQSVFGVEVALVAAALGVVAAIIATHPLWGSGWAAAT